MYPDSDVLRDLLSEQGVDGLSLWDLRCLAAYKTNVAASSFLWQQSVALQRLASDLEGEERVIKFAATSFNLHMKRWRNFHNERANAACSHTDRSGLHCAQCGAFLLEGS